MFEHERVYCESEDVLGVLPNAAALVRPAALGLCPVLRADLPPLLEPPPTGGCVRHTVWYA